MAVTKIITLAIQESLKIEVLTHALNASLPISRSHLKIRLLLFMSRKHFTAFQFCHIFRLLCAFKTEITFAIEMLEKKQFHFHSQLAFNDLFRKYNLCRGHFKVNPCLLRRAQTAGEWNHKFLLNLLD